MKLNMIIACAVILSACSSDKGTVTSVPKEPCMTVSAPSATSCLTKVEFKDKNVWTSTKGLTEGQEVNTSDITHNLTVSKAQAKDIKEIMCSYDDSYYKFPGMCD